MGVILDLNGDSTDKQPQRGIRVSWQAAAWMLAIVATAFMTYTATANSFDLRISMVERQQRDDRERQQDERIELRNRLERIEKKVDDIGSRPAMRER